MPLHLIKLCVGCDSIGELQGWITEQQGYAERAGRPYEMVHVTRMTPKRVSELAGGSLFWVMRGQVTCRQPVLELRPLRDSDGISRCGIVLDPKVLPVEPRPCRAFQGWRYLEAKDAPPDLSATGADIEAMPEEMRRDLVALGLI